MEVKGRGRAKFKAHRKTLPTPEYTLRGFTLRTSGLRLPAGVSIPLVWSRELASIPSMSRLYHDGLGHGYASFVARRQVEPAPETGGSIGIHRGVTTTATTTDPAYDLPHLARRRRCAAQLGKAQRRMSRRRAACGQAPSKGYLRARRQAGKLHEKAASQNRHGARIWAKDVVDNHHIIAVEDFTPLFGATSTMAGDSADGAINAPTAELIDRGTRAGATVVRVAPAYRAMMCSRCWQRQARLRLARRTFRCARCGFTAARDRNAPAVTLATAERNRGGVDDVSHVPPPLGWLLVLSGPEIPRLQSWGTVKGRTITPNG